MSGIIIYALVFIVTAWIAWKLAPLADFLFESTVDNIHRELTTNRFQKAIRRPLSAVVVGIGCVMMLHLMTKGSLMADNPDSSPTSVESPLKVTTSSAPQQGGDSGNATTQSPSQQSLQPISNSTTNVSPTTSIPQTNSPPISQAENVSTASAADKTIVSPPVNPQSSAPAQITFSPSFDCSRARTGAERMICSSKELAELDVELANVFRRCSDISDDKKSLRKQEDVWLQEKRDSCSSVTCMAKAYQERIDELRAMCAPR